MSFEIIVLFGGESNERFVSIASAQNIASTLINAKYWYWATNDFVFEIPRLVLLKFKNTFQVDFTPHTTPMFSNIFLALDSQINLRTVFLICLHGGKGEDGTIQYLFEQRKLFFTGSEFKSCYLCIDKNLSKRILNSTDIQIAESILFPSNISYYSDFSKFKYLIIKPNNNGSSFGLNIINKDIVNNLLGKMQNSFKYKYLLEGLLCGIELTVSVVENNGFNLTALIPIEMRSGHVFADYNAKYFGDNMIEVILNNIRSDIIIGAQCLALAAHRTLGCFGYSRTDMIFDNNGFTFLETNSLPGLTSLSLLPKALFHHKITMFEFLQQQLELSFKRYDKNL